MNPSFKIKVMRPSNISNKRELSEMWSNYVIFSYATFPTYSLSIPTNNSLIRNTISNKLEPIICSRRITAPTLLN